MASWSVAVCDACGNETNDVHLMEVFDMPVNQVRQIIGEFLNFDFRETCDITAQYFDEFWMEIVFQRNITESSFLSESFVGGDDPAREGVTQ